MKTITKIVGGIALAGIGLYFAVPKGVDYYKNVVELNRYSNEQSILVQRHLKLVNQKKALNPSERNYSNQVEKINQEINETNQRFNQLVEQAHNVCNPKKNN